MTAQIEQFNHFLKMDSLDSIEQLAFVESRTGLRPSQIAFAGIVFLGVVLAIAQASTLVLCIGCFLVPAYFSFASLESYDRNLILKYLTYWVVFSASEIVAFIFEFVLGPSLYAVSRVCFTVAMLHPSVQLAPKIYHRVIAPYVMGYEGQIDQKIEEIATQGKTKFDEVQRRIGNLMKKNE